MKFIDKGKEVQIQIAEKKEFPPRTVIHADFRIPKFHFEQFLDHVIEECKKAYKRDDLFPPITREEFKELIKDEHPPSPPPPPPGGFPI